MNNTVKQFTHCGAIRFINATSQPQRSQRRKKKPAVFEGVLEKNTELFTETARVLGYDGQIVS